MVVYSEDRVDEIEPTPIGYDPSARRLELANGRVLDVEVGSQAGLQGAVDWMNIKEDQTAVFGWAADIRDGLRVRFVAAFDRGEYLTQFQTEKSRDPSVLNGLGSSTPSRVGFIHRLSGAQERRVAEGEIRFVAVAQDWRAFELPVELADPSGD